LVSISHDTRLNRGNFVTERLHWAKNWRFGVLALAFLPVLFSAGGCPNLTDVADVSASALQWICPLFR